MSDERNDVSKLYAKLGCYNPIYLEDFSPFLSTIYLFILFLFLQILKYQNIKIIIAYINIKLREKFILK